MGNECAIRSCFLARSAMLSIRTVLCPVDLSPATLRQVDLAADLCRAFDATLVLHHNLPQVLGGAAVGWMWAADHPVSGNASEQQMRDLIARVSKGIKVDAHITHGLALPSILAVSEAVEADLLILSTHGAVNEDHTSVTERVLEDSDRAVLVLHDASEDSHTPNFASASGPPLVVLVPTDFTRESLPAVEFSFELARRLPIELHLLHLEPHGKPRNEERDLEKMTGLVPDDLSARTTTHIESGDAADGIAAAATRLDAACIIMGEHARTALRRWFSRNTSKAVLHKAHCPVWYVPGGRGARLIHDTQRPQNPAST
jgi:nucleotide-binding universal stress UspA family protein